ncbi:MAG: 30S ribosomal protein S16 [Acidobacteria bacterium]|nr:30S ribosomal protein S16 [Acidobacteriota bacterium]
MLTIRLARVGAKKKPHYRVVVIEKGRANTGRFVEIVGHYNPRSNPVDLTLKWERIEHWLRVGAQPSDTVRSLLKRHPAASEEVASPAA